MAAQRQLCWWQASTSRRVSNYVPRLPMHSRHEGNETARSLSCARTITNAPTALTTASSAIRSTQRSLGAVVARKQRGPSDESGEVAETQVAAARVSAIGVVIAAR